MRLSLSVLALASALAAPATAQEVFPAKLAGHAYLPALSLVEPPADAPRDAWLSGKFTGAVRNAQAMSVEGNTGKSYGNHGTGISLPFIGQPVQGMSGFAMTRAEDGSFYTLTDNGFGSKRNSPDALLFFHKMAPDFETGNVERRETVFLSDPDHKVPFRIAYEGTESRYLTGADFDTESIQVLDGEVWIGDEFGPYIIRAGLDGVVKEVFATELDGKELHGPDTYNVFVPAEAGSDYQVQRSGGYEGMALQPGTDLLWAMLEKPVLIEGGETEGPFLRVIAFDPKAGEWTGESVKFQLAEGATAIGDFNFIDETRALVIERDNGEGDMAQACAEGASDTSDCYPNPAKVKNIVLVDMSQTDGEGFIRRIGQIDLLNIADPDAKALDGMGAGGETFSFPFFTIEDVIAVDESHILVANDNNLPFSGGRVPGEAAHNEFILLDVPELLAAK
ncbi:esterase-like activity of phytase family protein [Salipiger sp. PrR002]|uniref:esterase-like activity of phytase family protein n=1 Tax=Salipiger sp. PrR002 TaxID=2706489 RepID=UPI0013B5B158|nr:esterase-like activity of phytase family protein [Salipiger sp. PrR002]NDV98251.1 esterase-like activity of phytase family protein [Salipiger sp. PrR002]NDW54963.1 esterase-like activity of phytase family protein [Salipiger sp. PrR004]